VTIIKNACDHWQVNILKKYGKFFLGSRGCSLTTSHKDERERHNATALEVEYIGITEGRE
jgi:hypothetical protein